MPDKHSILIVEDDAGVRDLIRTRLAAAGYDAHTAHTGREAMARLERLRPDASSWISTCRRWTGSGC